MLHLAFKRAPAMPPAVPVPVDDRPVRLSRLSEVLPVHHETLRRWSAKTGPDRLPARKVGSLWMISPNELRAFIDRQQAPTAPSA